MEIGIHFLDRDDNPIDHLGIGMVNMRSTSDVHAVKVVLRTEHEVNRVRLDLPEDSLGGQLQFSLTEHPFVPEALPLVVEGPFGDQDEIATLYVRVQAGEHLGSNKALLQAKEIL